MNQYPVIAILGGHRQGRPGPGPALGPCRLSRSSSALARLEKAEATAAELNATLNIDSHPRPGKRPGAPARPISAVLTVVQAAHQAALEGLKDDLQGKILVDATARVDFRDPSPPAPPAAARLAQDILGPGVRVVAAFQNVPAHSLRKTWASRWIPMSWSAPTTPPPPSKSSAWRKPAGCGLLRRQAG